MLKCTKCLEIKPESLFVQIKGVRVGMVCRKCRSAQIAEGRRNREAIASRVASRLALAAGGVARCNKCQSVKVDSEFPQKAGSRHGSVCKKCLTIQKEEWRSRTPAGIAAQERADKRKAARAQRDIAAADRKAKRKSALLPESRTTCTICNIEKANTEFCLLRGKRHGTRCADCASRATKEFRARRLEESPEYHRAMRSYEAMTRRAGLAKRMPDWANKEAIAAIYAARPTGHHVDHVIPLFGKLVSGLHVESNLQYLPAKENMKKNRSYTP